MYPTKQYQKIFEKIEKSILSCNNLDQIKAVSKLIKAFEKDCALSVHIEYLYELSSKQFLFIKK
jgi:hypothetical protein